MHKSLLFVLLCTVLAACDQLPFGDGRKSTRLTEAAFIEVYVKLAQANAPEEKARILEEAGTSREELDQFMRVYLADLPALSQVFDSVVARLGDASEERFPDLPVR